MGSETTRRRVVPAWPRAGASPIGARRTSVATAIAGTISPKCSAAGMPSPRTRAPDDTATSWPMLQMPWQEFISRRPLWCSMRSASTFIATLVSAKVTPNSANTRNSSAGVGATASRATLTAASGMPDSSKMRVPSLSTRRLATRKVRMAPTGWPSRVIPRTPASIPSPAWMSGMRVKIEPVASAWIRNARRISRRERRSGSVMPGGPWDP